MVDLYENWQQFQVPEVPDFRDGDWEVTVIEKTQAQVDRQKAMPFFFMSFDGGEEPRGREVPAGTYKKLQHHGRQTIVMSDTPAEIRDHKPLFDAVEDADDPRVLLMGLGLGVTIKACFELGASHIDVVEIDPVVIAHNGTFWRDIYGDRLNIIEDDAKTWKPEKGQAWDIAWFDIWDTISGDNLPEMGTLHRRFARRAPWRGSWCHDLVRSLRREEYRDRRRFWW